MSRTVLSIGMLGWLVSTGAGCAYLIEARAIDHFSAALEQKDMAALKLSTSEAFEQKALRLEDSLDDLKILNLPEGDTSVVKVEDVSEYEKQVTVKVGDSKRKLKYKLIRDPKTNKWLVDDVLVRQRRKGLVTVKSVTEQMDLLLTVREFVAAWEVGERDEVLNRTTSEFSEVLSALPPAYLARLTQQAVGKNSRRLKATPKAELDDGVAIVKLPRPVGEMVLTFRLQDGEWKVSDLAVESQKDGDHIPSVLKLATVMRTAADFLDAYHAADRDALARICTENLYRGSLAYAGFSLVELPDSDMPSGNYKVKLHARRADFVISGKREVVKIGLVRKDVIDADSPSDYRVDDVTIYDRDGSQQKRLSSMLTAHAMLTVFSEALANRDVAMLSKTSTVDFNRRVWKNVGPEIFAELPFKEIGNEPPRVLSTVFRGAVTEITALKGQRTVTYLLLDHEGQVRVDDVMLGVSGRSGRPSSLKTTLELMLPIRKFAAGMTNQDIDLLMRTSSKDFNRLVWKQLNRVPEIAYAATGHLRAPLSSMRQDPEQVLVTLGDDRWGAKVTLVRQFQQWVVDEVLLVAGVAPDRRAELKQTIRSQMANGQLIGQPRLRARQRESQRRFSRQERSPVQQPALKIEPSDDAFTPPLRQPSFDEG